MTCCERPWRVNAPIDRLVTDRSVRLRHIPGEVCLSCHDVSIPPVIPSQSLDLEIAKCLDGDYEAAKIVILKTRPYPQADSAAGSRCNHCGAKPDSSLLDVAIGDSASVVLEGVMGLWCWGCGTGIVTDVTRVGAQLNARSWTDGLLVPSLVYDTPRHPRSVQFEITTRCNLRCAYCSNPQMLGKDDVSVDDFVRMLDRIDFSHVDNVDFTGLGESALHHGLPQMVEEVYRRGRPSNVRLVTNGTILNDKHFVPLCKAGVTSIAFSIDSLDPERFARSRGGAHLDIVLDNLSALVQYRAAQKLSLSIKIKAVLVDDVYEEAASILKYSARMGLEMPHFSCLDARRSAQQFYRESWLKRQWSDDSGAFLEWVHEEWRRLGGAELKPAAQAGTPSDRASGFHHPLLPPANVCRWVVDASFIGAQGIALSCCEQMLDIPRITFGELKNSALSDLWRNEMLWGYRLPLSLGYVPARCGGCPRAPEHGIPMKALNSPQNDRTRRPA